MGIPDAPVPTSPYFFFSYARKDLNAYLKQFFQDLVKAVESLAGAEKVSFRDLEDMEPGDNWPDVLANALQESRVLVAIYSKWYFSRPYCGKEIQVFLDRRRSAGGGAEKITPVFWLAKDWLANYQLPPAAVGHIHYEHKNFPAEYLERGLRVMAMNRRKGYRDLVDALAERIIALAEKDPLPPHPEPPNLERIRSAFEAVTPTDPAVAVIEGPRIAQLLFLDDPEFLVDPAPASDAPGDIIASDPRQWKPFGTETSADILGILEEVVGPFYACQIVAPTNIRARIVDLQNRNVLPVLVLDLPFLAEPPGRNVLASLLDDAAITCGILITYDEHADGATAERLHLETWLQFGQRERARLLEIVGSWKALREGLSRILLGLQQRTVEIGKVHRMAEGEGPSERPLLRGPGNAR